MGFILLYWLRIEIKNKNWGLTICVSVCVFALDNIAAVDL